ncbi:Zn-ribbon domain-containing OB-fold protein [Actinomadura atramentaria]|uniref:Zn-ribbon domain-containing OB-fold protein n=1 Tax=Actinomadura atramentaria TaxID=1990 RepID=UPI00037EE97E|nr:OB-fold domain-containing protein [Actinomadura atramentaria]
MDDPRPAPTPSALTAPYWAACARGGLAIQRCAACARFVHLPRPACPYCGGDELPFTPVRGDGVVHTFTVVHRAFLPGFAPPYALAWIDLPEGARVFGDVTGCPPAAVRIGMPVRVHFTDRPGFGPMPHWRPL